MKEEEIENVGYIYRLWTVDDMKVLVRCQVHSYVESDNENEENEQNEYVNIYAMNEYESNSYLNKENYSMALLMKKELQNNHLKLTKWGVNCYLAGVNKMKIGFVTRKNIKENNEHFISGFYDVNTDNLLKVTNFNKFIAWGIVKEVIELIRRQKEDGSFI